MSDTLVVAERCYLSLGVRYSLVTFFYFFLRKFNTPYNRCKLLKGDLNGYL